MSVSPQVTVAVEDAESQAPESGWGHIQWQAPSAFVT